MRILFVAAAILSTVCADAFGQAYRWVDQDGRVHYTQTPPPLLVVGTQVQTGFHEGLLTACSTQPAIRLLHRLRRSKRCER
jgi:hypothetical protein